MYHPTNVVFLDDDPVFLNSMRTGIIRTNIPFITESNPEKILKYLQSHTYKPDDLSRLITKQNFEILNSEEVVDTFDINFASFISQLELPHRFKKITVVFVDQAMPQMAGLDFCRRIREERIPVKLILLTGKLGVSEAVQAFNDGIIDAYLPKEHRDLTQKVREHISKYSFEEFIELGNNLIGFVSHMVSPLYDEKFSDIFEQVRTRHKICEFYLLNFTCSFIMSDEDGKVKMLFVRNENDFKDLYELAKNSQASYEVLESIRSRQQFAFTKSNKGYLRLEDEMWENFMHPVDKVPGRDLYYSLVDRVDMKIFSFKQYFREVWPSP